MRRTSSLLWCWQLTSNIILCTFAYSQKYAAHVSSYFVAIQRGLTSSLLVAFCLVRKTANQSELWKLLKTCYQKGWDETVTTHCCKSLYWNNSIFYIFIRYAYNNFNVKVLKGQIMYRMYHITSFFFLNHVFAVHFSCMGCFIIFQLTFELQI